MVARTPGVPPPPAPVSPLLSESEKAIRRLLCVVYCGSLAYMDDGEAQDSRELPFIDFMRDTAVEIQQKMIQRSLKKLEEGENHGR